ncbi:Hypothetical_protein [Hexamita inflata]|uniref:Hypothetical_protein n=1 Tax=Hexamita inflata TaxID=28002 RepID=A0AA86PLD9_9EUKA|nr:Hypothetical protein HINF_LOCUS29151 [Hexamita inflata]
MILTIYSLAQQCTMADGAILNCGYAKCNATKCKADADAKICNSQCWKKCDSISSLVWNITKNNVITSSGSAASYMCYNKLGAAQIFFLVIGVEVIGITGVTILKEYMKQGSKKAKQTAETEEVRPAVA